MRTVLLLVSGVAEVQQEAAGQQGPAGARRVRVRAASGAAAGCTARGDTRLCRAAGNCVGGAVLARRLGNVHLCGENAGAHVIFRLLGNGGTTPACGRKRTLSCSERGDWRAWG